MSELQNIPPMYSAALPAGAGAKADNFAEGWAVRGAADNNEITTTETDIGDWRGTYSYPSGDVGASIASDDANDAGAGTGARVVQIRYLDSSYARQTTTVTLTGTTEVEFATDYFRTERVTVLTVGSGGSNAGALWVGASSDTWTAGVPASPYFNVGVGHSVSNTAIRTVPAGFKFEPAQWFFNGENSKIAFVYIEVRSPLGGGAYTPWYRTGPLTVESGGVYVPAIAAQALAAGTDLRLRGAMSSGTEKLFASLAGFLTRV